MNIRAGLTQEQLDILDRKYENELRKALLGIDCETNDKAPRQQEIISTEKSKKESG